jgi:predicted component of type VI protein secretion system
LLRPRPGHVLPEPRRRTRPAEPLGEHRRRYPSAAYVRINARPSKVITLPSFGAHLSTGRHAQTSAATDGLPSPLPHLDHAHRASASLPSPLRTADSHRVHRHHDPRGESPSACAASSSANPSSVLEEMLLYRPRSARTLA